MSFLLFFGFLCGSQNDWDWDLHRAFMEVDLRAWLVDLHPPLWSYQMCGGVTRIGDPEAFGLSPLFLFVITLGNLWGTILLVFSAAFAGYSFLWRTLLLLSDISGMTQNEQQARPLAKTFSLLFIFGNYFLCRFLMGHITYILIYVGIGIIYYSLKSLHTGLQRREFFFATFLVWCFFSAGFYHALVFFMTPVFLTLALCLCWNLTRHLLQKTTSFVIIPKALIHFFGFHLTGLLLASYKVIGIWRYQQANPRSVIALNEKFSGLLEFLALELFPLYKGKLLGVYEAQGTWNIWETSHFNIIHWFFPGIIVVLLIRWLKDKELGITFSAELKTMILSLALLAFIGTLFLAGNIPYGPHALLNILMADSIRVTPRYSITITFALCCITYLLVLQTSSVWRTLFNKGLICCHVLVLLNICLFLPNLDLKNFSDSLNTEHNISDKLHSLMIHPQGHRLKNIVAGHSVLNCFSPLNRKQVIAGNVTWNTEDNNAAPPVILPFIIQEKGKAPNACFMQSYFTQSQIHLDSSCPPGTCVNLNALSPYDAEQFALDSKRSRYCSK